MNRFTQGRLRLKLDWQVMQGIKTRIPESGCSIPLSPFAFLNHNLSAMAVASASAAGG
jgi:hypothetical protein